MGDGDEGESREKTRAKREGNIHVRPKHFSFQYALAYIRMRRIFSIKFCGFVPCTLSAVGSVRLDMISSAKFN
jgi:hypothetical protein